jgi:hypothetical protein
MIIFFLDNKITMYHGICQFSFNKLVKYVCKLIMLMIIWMYKITLTSFTVALTAAQEKLLRPEV